MGVQVLSASSQGILNTAPVLPATAYPMTLAAWFFPFTAVGGTIINYTDSATTNTWMGIRTSSPGFVPLASSSAAGTDQVATSTITPTVGQWYFVIGRFISATQRWIDHLDPATGATSHVANTTSSAPAGLDAISVGYRNASTPAGFQNGIVAEIWYCDADIQRGLSAATALDDGLFRTLAYKGPFVFPDIAANIVEYRSLQYGVDSSTDGFINGSSYSRVGRQTWTSTAAPILSNHPPLSSEFVLPNTVGRTALRAA